MKRFSVNVNITISSSIEVSAESAADAIKKAKTKFFANSDGRHYGLDAPCVDYDFDCEDEIDDNAQEE